MRRLMGLAAAMVTIAGAGCSSEPAARAAPPPREIEVLKLEPTEVRDTGEYLGFLFSRQSVTVLPQVAGYVRKIHVRPGQKVKAGDTLIEIDSRQEAAAVTSASAQQRSAAARLELARQTRDRTEALFKEGLVSAQEFERVTAEAAAADAAARAASAEVSSRQVQLQFHAIRAAVPGVIAEVTSRIGDFVNPGTPLTTIAQADVLELSVSIPAERARSLQPDTPVELLDAAGNVIVKSTLFYVAPEANPRTQLVEVKAAFENTAGLRPSELIRSRIVYSTRKALQIPALAVVRQSGQPFAYLLLQKDGKSIVERRPVTLGALGEMAYVLEAGLEEGDQIAVSSLQMLRDGAQVLTRAAPSPAKAASPLRVGGSR